MRIKTIIISAFWLIYLSAEAQTRILRINDPLGTSEIAVVSSKPEKNVQIEFLLKSADSLYVLKFKSDHFNINRGITNQEIKWLDTDTLFGENVLKKLGAISSVHQVNLALKSVSDDSLIFGDQYDSEVDYNLLNRITTEDTSTFYLNLKVDTGSLVSIIHKGKTSRKEKIQRGHPLILTEKYDSISFIFEDQLIHKIYYKSPEKDLPFDKFKYDTLFQDEANFIKLTRLSSNLGFVFSDSKIANSPQSVPYYQFNSEASLSIGALPIKANMYSFNQLRSSPVNLITNPGAEFKLAFDTEAFAQNNLINPSDPLLGAELNNKKRSIINEKMNLNAQLDELLLNQSAHVDSSFQFDSINPNKNLSGIDRLRYKKLERKARKLEEDEFRLKQFETKLDSLKVKKEPLIRSDIPTGRNGLKAGSLPSNSQFSRIELFEIGNVYPHRMQSVSHSFFTEMIGVKNISRIYNGISGYAFVANNKLNSNFPLPPVRVYEAGMIISNEKMITNIIGSLESPREIGSLPTASEYRPVLDSSDQSQFKNVYLSSKYYIKPELSIGVNVVVPISDIDSLDLESNYIQLNSTSKNKFVRLNGAIEYFPKRTYSIIDLSLLSDVLKLSASAGKGIFQDQIILEIGYDILFLESLEPGTKEDIQKSISSTMYIGFKGFPTFTFMYSPFSNIRVFEDPISRLKYISATQTELWIGSASYSKSLGNSLLNLNTSYQHISNSVVFDRFGASYSYSGKIESLSSIGSLQNSRHKLLISAIKLKGEAFEQNSTQFVYNYSLSTNLQIGSRLGLTDEQAVKTLNYFITNTTRILSKFSLTSELGIYQEIGGDVQPAAFIQLQYSLR